MAIPTGPDTWVHTSSQGFRDREYAAAKASGSYRVLGVGDSLMFGWGVDEGRDYLSVLERRLEREHPERSWEVINTAVPGYNTVMEGRPSSQGWPTLPTSGRGSAQRLRPSQFHLGPRPYLSLRTSLMKRFVGEASGVKGGRRQRLRIGEQTAPLHAGSSKGPGRSRALPGWWASSPSPQPRGASETRPHRRGTRRSQTRIPLFRARRWIARPVSSDPRSRIRDFPRSRDALVQQKLKAQDITGTATTARRVHSFRDTNQDTVNNAFALRFDQKP